ncbi:hypothetical protein ACJRO7_007176 [Eucalyptus globulus]|uniref:Uncharacterized protein n=1 Tax=Eucalyptus globulus TaxID=34317 RepID=A0ABD3IN26_EUCGL
MYYLKISLSHRKFCLIKPKSILAGQVMLYTNVFASSIEMDAVPFDDHEYIQSNGSFVKFARMCFFVVEHANHWCYVEDLLSLKHGLCWHGSHLFTDHDTGCHVSLDSKHVERMVMQNSHCKKMPFVATCDVILPKSGDFSDFGVVPTTTEAEVDLIQKRKRNEGFDADNLKLEMGLEQFVNGCKRLRAC